MYLDGLLLGTPPLPLRTDMAAGVLVIMVAAPIGVEGMLLIEGDLLAADRRGRETEAGESEGAVDDEWRCAVNG